MHCDVAIKVFAGKYHPHFANKRECAVLRQHCGQLKFYQSLYKIYVLDLYSKNFNIISEAAVCVSNSIFKAVKW